MTEKGGDSKIQICKGNGEKAWAEENGRPYISILYIFIMITTCQRFRTEIYKIKQEGPEGKPTKANQNKENRNTKTRKQWQHQTTWKQKIKWL